MSFFNLKKQEEWIGFEALSLTQTFSWTRKHNILGFAACTFNEEFIQTLRGCKRLVEYIIVSLAFIYWDLTSWFYYTWAFTCSKIRFHCISGFSSTQKHVTSNTISSVVRSKLTPQYHYTFIHFLVFSLFIFKISTKCYPKHHFPNRQSWKKTLQQVV